LITLFSPRIKFNNAPTNSVKSEHVFALAVGLMSMSDDPP